MRVRIPGLYIVLGLVLAGLIHIVAVLTKVECRRVANGTGADDHNTHLALPAYPSRLILDAEITGSWYGQPYCEPPTHHHSDLFVVSLLAANVFGGAVTTGHLDLSYLKDSESTCLIHRPTRTVSRSCIGPQP